MSVTACLVFYPLLPVPIKTKHNTSPLLSIRLDVPKQQQRGIYKWPQTVYQNATNEKTAANALMRAHYSTWNPKLSSLIP